MLRKVSLILFVLVLSLTVAVPAALAGRGDGPVIYVTGQGLLIPCDSREEGEQIIRDIKGKDSEKGGAR